MVPLIGFLEGDTLGILVFANPNDTIKKLSHTLMLSAQVRTPGFTNAICIYDNKVLNAHFFVKDIGFKPLDRFDVRRTTDES